MAMNGTNLGDTIVDFLKTLNPRITGSHETRLRQRWEGIAQIIVAHIQTNADVLSAAHSGDDLNNPVGQLLSVPGLGILDHGGGACTGTSTTGTTSVKNTIAGKGSIQ